MLELHFQNSKKLSKTRFVLLLKQDVIFLKELCEAKNSQITGNKKILKFLKECTKQSKQKFFNLRFFTELKVWQM